MADKLIEKSALANVFRVSAPGAATGYDEQWQRALEKAYLERQKESAQSPNSSGNARDLATRSSPEPPERQALSVDAGLAGVLPTASMPGKADPTGMTLPSVCIQPTGKAASGSVRGEPVPAGQDGLSPFRQQTTIRKGAATARQLAVRLQGQLPVSSSLKLLNTEQGVHVVIRDASLNDNEIRRLLQRVREVLAGSDRPLEAVTWNGERLWEVVAAHGGAETTENHDQQIDRLY